MLFWWWLPLILFFSQSLFLFQKLCGDTAGGSCFSVSWCPRIDHLHGEKYHDPLVESEWLLCWAIIPAGWQVESSLFIFLPYFRNTFSLQPSKDPFTVFCPRARAVMLGPNELTCVRLHPGWVQFTHKTNFYVCVCKIWRSVHLSQWSARRFWWMTVWSNGGCERGGRTWESVWPHSLRDRRMCGYYHLEVTS